MGNAKLTRLMQRLLAGRYGSDRLGRFLSQSSVALLIISFLTRRAGTGRLSSFLSSVGLALLFFCYYRMFSRNTEKREAENQRYLEKEWAVRDWMNFNKDHYDQRKEYAFFTCPGCRQIVRVPKNKGRIRITCRRCGYSFDKKT